MGSQMVGLGGSELILVAAIALVMAAVSRLAGLERPRGNEAGRAYLDRLLGPARGPKESP